jgi:methionyl aminopeptidase
MDEIVYKKYRKAGKISRGALEYGISLIEENKKYLEVAEKVEKYIADKGAKPAFPANISVNEVAAHYTPSINDDSIFAKGDVVKLDVGAHVDGWIGDNAATIEVGTNDRREMIDSCDEALNAAINLIEPGVSISEIGSVIEKKIEEKNFLPISNLTGHSLDKYQLHAGLSIPNIGNKNGHELKEGDVIAIEPFATNGIGRVKDWKNGNIYSFREYKPVRDPIARKILRSVKNRRLPFASRWLYDIAPNPRLAISMLSAKGLIIPYKILVEEGNGIVAQSENTVIVTNDGCDVTTK